MVVELDYWSCVTAGLLMEDAGGNRSVIIVVCSGSRFLVTIEWLKALRNITKRSIWRFAFLVLNIISGNEILDV